jgi:SpoVK/Ycf46/Vps4 family AAA+-type ATPase
MLKLFDNYEDLRKEFISNSKSKQQPLPVFVQDPGEIETLDQVLSLIGFIEDHKLYLIDDKYHRLLVCKESIVKLQQMIGLKEAKANMAQQILSLCDRSRISSINKINSVIYGPPGCGKTTLAQVLAEMYLKLGTVSTNKIVRGDRANMIGEFVGQTAIKTKKLLETALGGVLLIDEAYQLGHAADGNRCPFAYECINTINQFITENPGNLVIILAGYQKDIEQNFFAQNDGLARRFPFRYTIEGYNDKELLEIFRQQAGTAGYSIEDAALDSSIFQDHKLFEFYGGDTENLFNCCRMYHDKRMFAQLQTDTVLTRADVTRGLAMFRKHKSGGGDKTSEHWRYMFT